MISTELSELTFDRGFLLIRASMRKIITLCALVALHCGCHSTKKNEAAAPTAPKKKVSAATAPGPSDRPTVRPVQAVIGRVIGVRDNLRFVVVDFGASKMPKLDQQLTVYRLDQKVAELKVSGPYLGTTVAADVTAGEAREGDLVREQ
jgi:hypothetical protein